MKMPAPRIALINPIASRSPPVSVEQAYELLKNVPNTRLRIGMKEVLRLTRTRSTSLVVIFSTLPLRNVSLLLAMTAIHKGIPYAVLPPGDEFRKSVVKEFKIAGSPVAVAIVGAPCSDTSITSREPGGGVLLKEKGCIYTYVTNNSNTRRKESD